MAAQGAESGGYRSRPDRVEMKASPTTPEPPEQDQEVGEHREPEVAASDVMTGVRAGRELDSTEAEPEIQE